MKKIVCLIIMVVLVISGCTTSERFVTERESVLPKCTYANLVLTDVVYIENSQSIQVTLFNFGTHPDESKHITLKDYQVKVVYKGAGSPEPTTWTIEATLEPNTQQTLTRYLKSMENVDYVEVRSVECPDAYDITRDYDVRRFP